MLKHSNLISQRFSSASPCYRRHAIVQQEMAKYLSNELLSCMQTTPHGLNQSFNILEIGCGTGFLTEQLIHKIKNINQYFANDLYPDAKDYLLPLFSSDPGKFLFIEGDATQIKLLNQVDIVAGGAVLQWIKDIGLLFFQLSEQVSDNALLAFSSFAPGHYHEIKSITGKTLDYQSPELIALKAQPYFRCIFKETKVETLFFDSPMLVLRHMKETGVNAITQTQWKKRDLQNFIDEYEQFKTSQGYPLTYCPLYVILQKTGI